MNLAIDKMQDLWVSVCSPQDITPGTGVCALVGGRQVALFCCRQTQAFYAIDNFDPIGGASVLSRGIMGSIAGEPVVASPLYKHYFNLNTGRCIQTPEHQLNTYPVRISGTEVQIGINS